jgi:hypothetical protein
MTSRPEIRSVLTACLDPRCFERRRVARRRTIALALVLALSPAIGAFADDPSPCGADGSAHAPPGHVFDSVERAAIHALAHARVEATPHERGRYLSGTIQRVAGGYTYGDARASSASVWDRVLPILRLRLTPSDVASYVVHPASGRWDLDRRNERPNRDERRLVDEVDAASRPLFVLTPSRRIKRYADRQLVELTRLEAGGEVPPLPTASLADRTPGPAQQTRLSP